jgi:hypothetical protein
MTKTGTGQGITKKFTKDAPVESGYYWIKKNANLVPAYIFENKRVSWGSIRKIRFIGDAYEYPLPMAEQLFSLEYGGRCL